MITNKLSTQTHGKTQMSFSKRNSESDDINSFLVLNLILPTSPDWIYSLSFIFPNDCKAIIIVLFNISWEERHKIYMY